MSVSEFFFALPIWIGAAILLLLHFAAAEACFAYGRKMPEKKIVQAIETEMTSDVIHTAMLTLLALLIAFTVSMAAYRFETRRQIVVDESNAIGTAYLRTGVVSKPCQDKLRNYLRDYVDNRLLFYKAPYGDPSIRGTERETKILLRKIWDTSVACVLKDTNEAKALLLRAMNTTIDLRETQNASFENRIPRTLMILICLASILLMGYTGYLCGVHRQRPGMGAAILSIFIVMSVGVILDLDRPRQGTIRLDVTPLETLRKDLSEK
jgi:hypothetical protein